MKRPNIHWWAILLSVLLLWVLRFMYWTFQSNWRRHSWEPQEKVAEDILVDDDLPDRLKYLVEEKYTSAQNLEEFSSNLLITRATATPFLARYWYLEELNEKSSDAECDFPDIKEKSNDLQKAIVASCKYHLLRWSNGNFLPDGKLLKQELLTVLVRSKTWFLSEDIDPWFKNYYDWADDAWLIEPWTTLADFWWTVSKQDLWRRLYKLASLD